MTRRLGEAWYDRWSFLIAFVGESAMRKTFFYFFFLVFSATVAVAQKYDLVIEGGRVMDPETGLDAVRNVGIRGGRLFG